MSRPDSLLAYLTRGGRDEVRTAALVGREVDPTLDVESTLEALGAMAEGLVVPARADAETAARALSEHAFGELGFHGNVGHYYDPANSLLHHVIARRTGIPITLAVVFLALGRKVGLDVVGIGFPGHFLLRVGGPRGVLVDPFHDGRVLGPEDLGELAERFLGPRVTPGPDHLRPVDAPALAVRMLGNLEAAYVRVGERGLAMVTADRLFELSQDPAHRRDRGMHAHAIGAHTLAAEDLSAYLDARPDAADAGQAKAVLTEARKALRKSQPPN